MSRTQVGDGRATTVPAQRVCSSGATRKRLRWPEVPLESPTVQPSMSHEKSRSCSAASATRIAWSRVRVRVFKRSKCCISSVFSTLGRRRQSCVARPAQCSRQDGLSARTTSVQGVRVHGQTPWSMPRTPPFKGSESLVDAARNSVPLLDQRLRPHSERHCGDPMVDAARDSVPVPDQRL